MKLVEIVYEVTKRFPDEERYGLVSQMRRAAVSIPSNIAEGKCRGSDRELRKFLRIAFGSGAELETQFELARRLRFLEIKDFRDLSNRIDTVMIQLNAFLSKLKC